MIKSRNITYYLAAFVSLATFSIYLPALQNDFITWDDADYVITNLHIRSLNLAFFKWAFSGFYASNWHPLTWVSHALDYAVWGLSPLGHHLTNNILHAMNTFLVVLLCIKLLAMWKERLMPDEASTFPDERRIMIAAGVTGLLFGLHPLHVESVAWVAERKDLLCGLFFLLSISAYTNHLRGLVNEPIEKKKAASLFFNRSYLVSLAFFVLALLSKPMAVSLPLVLLALDWGLLDRIWPFDSFKAAFAEKLPFIALSGGSALLTFLAQKKGGTIASFESLSLSERALVAANSLALYLWKMILPLDLVPYYPYPKDVSFLSLQYMLPVVLLVAITVFCLATAKKQRLWLVCWGYYVITLLPVLGIVKVGDQAMADRYTYLPSLGPFLATGLAAAWIWGKADVLKEWRLTVKSIGAGTALLAVLSLSYLTFKQIGTWKDSLVFWNYVIAKEPDKIFVAYNNRGVLFDEMGQPERAIEDYNKAIALDPTSYMTYNNRGIAFKGMGWLDRAIEDYNKAIVLNPTSLELYLNRGAAFEEKGQLSKAIEDNSKAIALDPSFHEAYVKRGNLYLKTNDKERALSDFQKACTLGDKNGCLALQAAGF